MTNEQTLDVAKSGAILAVSWLAYSVVRLATTGSAEVARANAELVHSLQSTLGIGIEASVQDAILSETVAMVANSYYLLHFPLTVLLLAVMFARRRTTLFPIVRDGLVGMTFVGLAVHLVFPLAPPRMLSGIVDASAVYGPNPYAIPGSGTANQFAAMPSMHVAWAIVAGWALYRSTDNTVARFAAVLHPLVTALVVLVTGHHYVLDIVVGAIVAIAVLRFVAAVYERRTRAVLPDRVDKAEVVHSSSTAKSARNRAKSPSYPLVAHRRSLAPLTVCSPTSKNRPLPRSRTGQKALSHPVVTME